MMFRFKTCALFVKKNLIKKPHQKNDEALINNIPPNVKLLVF